MPAAASAHTASSATTNAAAELIMTAGLSTEQLATAARDAFHVASLSAPQLATAARDGDSFLAAVLAAAEITGEDVAALVEAKRAVTLAGNTSALAKCVDRLADSWLSEPSGNSLVFDANVCRGADGSIGLEILDDPSLCIFNVVVGIMPGSRAERDGYFQLGDVILEVDGTPLSGAMWNSIVTEVRDVIEQNHKSAYRFTVLRAIELLVAPSSPASAATAPTDDDGVDGAVGADAAEDVVAPIGGDGLKRFKLDLAGVGDSGHLSGRSSPRHSLPLFDPCTPRHVIFRHAAVLTAKHQKLARARGVAKPVPSPQQAEAARAGSLTPRQITGRAESDAGLAV